MATTPAKGTLLQAEISSVFTTIAQRTSVVPMKSKRNKIETTDLDSTDETSFGGIRRNGPITFKAWMDPADTGHIFLATTYGANTTINWKTILQNAGSKTYTFAAWIEEFDIGEVKVDGLVELSLTLCVTGSVTL